MWGVEGLVEQEQETKWFLLQVHSTSQRSLPLRSRTPAHHSAMGRNMATKTKSAPKSSQKSGVSHANNKTRRTWKPNLQVVRTLHEGKIIKVKASTRCLAAGKITRAPRGQVGVVRHSVERRRKPRD